MNTLILCRLCAEEDKNCVDVFSVDGNKYNIEKKIRMCLPLKIYENDDLPKQVCLSCLNKLDTCYELYCGCLSAQTTIKKLYESTKKNNSNTAIHHSNEVAKELLPSKVVDFNSNADQAADSFIKIAGKVIKLQDYLLHKDSFGEPLMKSRRLDCIASDSPSNQLNTSSDLSMHTDSESCALQQNAASPSLGGVADNEMTSLYILNDEPFTQSAADVQNTNLPYLDSHLLNSSSPKLYSDQTSMSGQDFGFNLTTPTNPKATFPQYLESNELDVRKQNISSPFLIPHSNQFSNYGVDTVPTILTLSDTTNNKSTASNTQPTQFAVLPSVPIQQDMFVLDTDMQPLNMINSSNNSLHPQSLHHESSFKSNTYNQESLQSSSLFNILCGDKKSADISSRTKSPLVPKSNLATTRDATQELGGNSAAIVGSVRPRTNTVNANMVPRTTPTMSPAVQPSYNMMPVMQASMLRTGPTLSTVSAMQQGYTLPTTNVPQATSAPLLKSRVGPSVPIANVTPNSIPSVTSNTASIFGTHAPRITNVMSILPRTPLTSNVMSVPSHATPTSNMTSRVGSLVLTSNVTPTAGTITSVTSITPSTGNMPTNVTQKTSSLMSDKVTSTLTAKLTSQVSPLMNTATTAQGPLMSSENNLETSPLLLKRSSKEFPPRNASFALPNVEASDSESSDGGMYDAQEDEVVLSDTEPFTVENVLHRACEFCKKQFPENIIDHHRSLHFRDHFYSCIDCNKNFRTSQGLEGHRCAISDETPQNT